MVFGVLAVVAFRLHRLYQSTRSDVVGAVGLALVILLANSLFANGTFYQPSGASILFLAMFVSGIPRSSFGNTWASKSPLQPRN